jgi:hypothetical protein
LADETRLHLTAHFGATPMRDVTVAPGERIFANDAVAEHGLVELAPCAVICSLEASP